MIVALGDRDTGYLTHREIDAALALFPTATPGHWVATDSREADALDGADGVWLLPGTPYRNAEAAFAAIRHCLATGTPFLGTCGGSSMPSSSSRAAEPGSSTQPTRRAIRMPSTRSSAASPAA